MKNKAKYMAEKFVLAVSLLGLASCGAMQADSFLETEIQRTGSFKRELAVSYKEMAQKYADRKNWAGASYMTQKGEDALEGGTPLAGNPQERAVLKGDIPDLQSARRSLLDTLRRRANRSPVACADAQVQYDDWLVRASSNSLGADGYLFFGDGGPTPTTMPETAREAFVAALNTCSQRIVTFTPAEPIMEEEESSARSARSERSRARAERRKARQERAEKRKSRKRADRAKSRAQRAERTRSRSQRADRASRRAERAKSRSSQRAERTSRRAERAKSRSSRRAERSSTSRRAQADRRAFQSQKGKDLEVVGTRTIYFDFASTKIDSTGTRIIRNIARTLRDYDKNRVEITGHTDSSGGKGYNKALGKRRAVAAAGALKSAARRRSVNIFTKSDGESDLAVKTADNVREPLNRRVEIVIKGE